jgi:hypothetical protein
MTDPFFDLVRHIVERHQEDNQIDLNLDKVVVPVDIEVYGKDETYGFVSEASIIIHGEYKDLDGRKVRARPVRLTLQEACKISCMLMDAVNSQIEAVEAEENDD